MSRFGACLLQGSADEVEGAMASIFVWLRYSSARHLTWQRNYNTQPRILGEAQAKLTHKIAEVGLCIRPCITPLLTMLLASIGSAIIVHESKQVIQGHRSPALHASLVNHMVSSLTMDPVALAH